jgi:hypothetical protein
MHIRSHSYTKKCIFRVLVKLSTCRRNGNKIIIIFYKFNYYIVSLVLLYIINWEHMGNSSRVHQPD